MKVWIRLLVLLMVLIVPAAAQTANLTVDAPDNVDETFTLTIRTGKIENFRGLEFEVNVDSTVLSVANARTTGVLASSSVSVNQDGKVIVFSPVPIELSGNILLLDMSATGSSGDSSYINLSKPVISVGQAQPIIPKTFNDTVVLGACVDYSSTHTGDGSQIPGTGCACNTGTKLIISPTTQKWSCQVTNSTDVFLNSQDCSVGDDNPIYDTGYCCIDGYQLNQSFNHFDDLLGNPNLACTVIPNTAPIANIFQLPAEVYIGNSTSFSSLGSQDSDGNIVAYDWDFGDSSTHSNLASPSHIYSSVSSCPDGTCIISLTVTDDDNATGTFQDSFTLSSFAGAQAPQPVCGNGIVETGETCDGNDTAACDLGCNSICSCSLTSTDSIAGIAIEVGRTYTINELASAGLTVGADTALPDGRVVTVNSLGTITDIRASEEPPSTTACGNGKCEVGENSAICLQDCHFGDRVCQTSLGESNANAPTDCPKKGSAGLVIILLLVVGLLGAGGFIAVKKGWFSMGPLMHHKMEGPSGGANFDINRLAEAHQVTQPHNDTDKLKNFIKSSQRQGFSFSEIKNSLTQKGWSEDKINAAFAGSA